MKLTDILLLVSSVVVAIPTIRAAYRILSARWKANAAAKKEAGLARLDGQRRQTETLAVERLKNEANDLIEFSTLVPTWALWFALSGIFLNIAIRAIAVFQP
jgi:hypothetical protein